MKSPYTARATKLNGRNNYVIMFRHPMRMENGKPGRKVSKGLGTDDQAEAYRLEKELNELLANEELHSVGQRSAAEKIYDARIVEIFYTDLDPISSSPRLIRDRILPLPKRGSDGHMVSMFVGITGSGKSTTLRRLAGTGREKFPTTSVNRTTTCEIEFITGKKDYRAAVTFLTLHQTQEEIIESLSAATLKAIEGKTREDVAIELLDQSDQRFRLKYILGDYAENDDGTDDFTFGEAEGPTTSKSVSPFVQTTIDQIYSIAGTAKQEVEAVLGTLETLKGENRDYALDEMQNSASQSDEFHQLVNQIIEEISDRFTKSPGTYEKSSTGWPIAWKITTPDTERSSFFSALKQFCGAAKDDWGSLLTPIVTGIRLEGPFRPDWVPAGEDYKHVFIDTEGLLHSKSVTEIPSLLTSRFKDVDNIILAESAKNALHSPVAGRVFEAIASTGFTPNFSLVFTHMDAVVGDNLTTSDLKRQHVFGGARNIIDHQVAKTVSRRAADQLADHLKGNTFYFSYLDPEKYPVRDPQQVSVFEKRLGSQLHQMLVTLSQRSNSQYTGTRIPNYSFDSLTLAVQEASLEFIDIYEAHLGFRHRESISTAHWQTIKAMSRRYAEGWFDGFKLHPVDTLLTVTRNVIAKFLENPIDWVGGTPTLEEKTAVINRLQQVINDDLTALSKARLIDQPKTDWQGAYGLKGSGSTFHRKQLVRGIFQQQVPIPRSISDRWAQEWVEDIRRVVKNALEKLKDEQK